MSFTATVDNSTVKLPQHVPDGTRVEIHVVANDSDEVSESSFYERYKDFIGKLEGLPEDLAAEHDHYIHGREKKNGQ